MIREVSLRDGLQNEPGILTPAVRAEFVDRFTDAGLKAIQIGSFVNPKLVPQMAGADEVWRLCRQAQEVDYSVLALSKNGVETSAQCGIPHVEIYVSASDTHSRRNVGKGSDAALEVCLEMIDRAASYGLKVTAGVMCAFHCHYEGPMDPAVVLKIVRQFPLHKIHGLGLADTTGGAYPEQVSALVGIIKDYVDTRLIGLHLHDTYGRGADNLRAGLEAGVRQFDASVAGLGGCPFIPGAKGNISTESVLEILTELGFSTGVDAHAVSSIGQDLLGSICAASIMQPSR